MGEQGENLARIVSAWLAVLRSGDLVELAGLLDPNVVWQGVHPDEICRNRGQVLDILVRNKVRPPRLTRIEASEHGDSVAVSVQGPDFPETDTLTADAPRSLVFTFQAGMVVRIESFSTADAAFALVASSQPGTRSG
jgi:hypothetical protein